MYIKKLAAAVAIFGLAANTAQAQFGLATNDSPRLGGTQTEQWRVGLRVSAQGGPCAGLLATVPVPTDWPEQSVKLIQEDVSPEVRTVQHRVLEDGVKQMVVSIPQLPAGGTAHAILTFEITRRQLVAPDDPAAYTVPRRPSRDLRKYLAPSPYIETRHADIRGLAKELTDESLPAWEQVESFYDWVRENITYENGPLKGAVAALRDKTGDCEELTSLFIALCRNAGIPARTVWVPDHCYPEFYLEDSDGQGHWFPCQAAGARDFGGMFEARPILQKGDNFRVPEKKERQRYVAEYLTGKAIAGGGRPAVEFIREATRVE